MGCTIDINSAAQALSAVSAAIAAGAAVWTVRSSRLAAQEQREHECLERRIRAYSRLVSEPVVGASLGFRKAVRQWLDESTVQIAEAAETDSLTTLQAAVQEIVREFDSKCYHHLHSVVETACQAYADAKLERRLMEKLHSLEDKIKLAAERLADGEPLERRQRVEDAVGEGVAALVEAVSEADPTRYAMKKKGV